jgi:hypothetical protein
MIYDILGIDRKEYMEKMDKYFKEFGGFVGLGADKEIDVVKSADKFLEWIDDGDTTDRLLKAIAVIKLTNISLMSAIDVGAFIGAVWRALDMMDDAIKSGMYFRNIISKIKGWDEDD